MGKENFFGLMFNRRKQMKENCKHIYVPYEWKRNKKKKYTHIVLLECHIICFTYGSGCMFYGWNV